MSEQSQSARLRGLLAALLAAFQAALRGVAVGAGEPPSCIRTAGKGSVLAAHSSRHRLSLRPVSLPLPHLPCAGDYPNTFSGICGGDSGSPLVAKGSGGVSAGGSQDLLVGIASFASAKCGTVARKPSELAGVGVRLDGRLGGGVCCRGWWRQQVWAASLREARGYSADAAGGTTSKQLEPVLFTITHCRPARLD